jgi:cytoskeleton protein RodZ
MRTPEGGTADPAGDNIDAPGKQIHRFREAKSVGAEELAARLRLNVRVIRSLEADDYSALPHATFVKGYIRAIAKELDFDPAPVLAAYSFHAKEEPPPIVDFESRAPAQITTNSAVVKGTTYGLIILLIVMIAIWWRGFYAERDGLAGDDDATVTTSPANAHSPLPYSYIVVEHPDTVPSPTQPDADAGAGPVAETETLLPTDDGETVGAALPVEPEAEAPLRDIHIATVGEAWIEILDADDRRLHYSLMQAGTETDLGGTPPYRLVIGNSPVVQLRFRGRVIDLQAVSEQGIAKLTLEVTDE